MILLILNMKSFNRSDLIKLCQACLQLRKVTRPQLTSISSLLAGFTREPQSSKDINIVLQLVLLLFANLLQQPRLPSQLAQPTAAAAINSAKFVLAQIETGHSDQLCAAFFSLLKNDKDYNQIYRLICPNIREMVGQLTTQKIQVIAQSRAAKPAKGPLGPQFIVSSLKAALQSELQAQTVFVSAKAFVCEKARTQLSDYLCELSAILIKLECHPKDFSLQLIQMIELRQIKSASFLSRVAGSLAEAKKYSPHLIKVLVREAVKQPEGTRHLSYLIQSCTEMAKNTALKYKDKEAIHIITDLVVLAVRNGKQTVRQVRQSDAEKALQQSMSILKMSAQSNAFHLQQLAQQLMKRELQSAECFQHILQLLKLFVSKKQFVESFSHKHITSLFIDLLRETEQAQNTECRLMITERLSKFLLGLDRSGNLVLKVQHLLGCTALKQGESLALLLKVVRHQLSQSQSTKSLELLIGGLLSHSQISVFDMYLFTLLADSTVFEHKVQLVSLLASMTHSDSEIHLLLVYLLKTNQTNRRVKFIKFTSRQMEKLLPLPLKLHLQQMLLVRNQPVSLGQAWGCNDLSALLRGLSNHLLKHLISANNKESFAQMLYQLCANEHVQLTPPLRLYDQLKSHTKINFLQVGLRQVARLLVQNKHCQTVAQCHNIYKIIEKRTKPPSQYEVTTLLHPATSFTLAYQNLQEQFYDYCEQFCPQLSFRPIFRQLVKARLGMTHSMQNGIGIYALSKPFYQLVGTPWLTTQANQIKQLNHNEKFAALILMFNNKLCSTSVDKTLRLVLYQTERLGNLLATLSPQLPLSIFESRNPTDKVIASLQLVINLTSRNSFSKQSILFVEETIVKMAEQGLTISKKLLLQLVLLLVPLITIARSKTFALLQGFSSAQFLQKCNNLLTTMIPPSLILKTTDPQMLVLNLRSLFDLMRRWDCSNHAQQYCSLGIKTILDQLQEQKKPPSKQALLVFEEMVRELSRSKAGIPQSRKAICRFFEIIDLDQHLSSSHINILKIAILPSCTETWQLKLNPEIELDYAKQKQGICAKGTSHKVYRCCGQQLCYYCVQQCHEGHSDKKITQVVNEDCKCGAKCTFKRKPNKLQGLLNKYNKLSLERSLERSGSYNRKFSLNFWKLRHDSSLGREIQQELLIKQEEKQDEPQLDMQVQAVDFDLQLRYSQQCASSISAQCQNLQQILSTLSEQKQIKIMKLIAKSISSSLQVQNRQSLQIPKEDTQVSKLIRSFGTKKIFSQGFLNYQLESLGGNSFNVQPLVNRRHIDANKKYVVVGGNNKLKVFLAEQFLQGEQSNCQHIFQSSFGFQIAGLLFVDRSETSIVVSGLHNIVLLDSNQDKQHVRWHAVWNVLVDKERIHSVKKVPGTNLIAVQLFRSVHIFQLVGSNKPYLTLKSDSDAGIVRDFTVCRCKDHWRFYLGCGDGNIYSTDFSIGNKGERIVSTKLTDSRKRRESAVCLSSFWSEQFNISILLSAFKDKNNYFGVCHQHQYQASTIKLTGFCESHYLLANAEMVEVNQKSFLLAGQLRSIATKPYSSCEGLPALVEISGGKAEIQILSASRIHSYCLIESEEGRLRYLISANIDGSITYYKIRCKKQQVVDLVDDFDFTTTLSRAAALLNRPIQQIQNPLVLQQSRQLKQGVDFSMTADQKYYTFAIYEQVFLTGVISSSKAVMTYGNQQLNSRQVVLSAQGILQFNSKPIKVFTVERNAGTVTLFGKQASGFKELLEKTALQFKQSQKLSDQKRAQACLELLLASNHQNLLSGTQIDVKELMDKLQSRIQSDKFNRSQVLLSGYLKLKSIFLNNSAKALQDYFKFNDSQVFERVKESALVKLQDSKARQAVQKLAQICINRYPSAIFGFHKNPKLVAELCSAFQQGGKPLVLKRCIRTILVLYCFYLYNCRHQQIQVPDPRKAMGQLIRIGNNSIGFILAAEIMVKGPAVRLEHAGCKDQQRGLKEQPLSSLEGLDEQQLLKLAFRLSQNCFNNQVQAQQNKPTKREIVFSFQSVNLPLQALRCIIFENEQNSDNLATLKLLLQSACNHKQLPAPSFSLLVRELFEQINIYQNVKYLQLASELVSKYQSFKLSILSLINQPIEKNVFCSLLCKDEPKIIQATIQILNKTLSRQKMAQIPLQSVLIEIIKRFPTMQGALSLMGSFTESTGAYTHRNILFGRTVNKNFRLREMLGEASRHAKEWARWCEQNQELLLSRLEDAPADDCEYGLKLLALRYNTQ